MVGKILDKRYVVLEEVGADGAGFRYLVYDMNTLRRLHLRVDPDGNGQLSGNTYTVVEMDAPLAAAPPAREVSAPAAARERRTSPAATPRPRRPTPKGFAPPTDKPAEEPEEKPAKAGVNVARTVPENGDKDSVPIPRLDALPSKTAPPQEPALLRKPKATPVPPGLEEKPLEQALERALTDAKPAAERQPPPAEKTKDPFNTTQPIDLASAEEIAQEAQEQKPAPKQDQRQSGERPRIQTKVLEAAWFAQGDQLEEEEGEEQAAEAAHRPVDHDQLERQAAELSPDEYRKYALDLPPPMPPPVRIVEAFLGAKPDVVARLVDQQQDRTARPAPSSPPEPATPTTTPPQGASPFQIAPPPVVEPVPPPVVEPVPPPVVEPTPPPVVEPTPPPVVKVAPPPAVEPVPPPVVEPVPPPKIEPVPPPKIEPVPPPKIEVAPPPKIEPVPPPKIEPVPPPTEVPPPVATAPAPAPAVMPPVEQVLSAEPAPPLAAPEPAPQAVPAAEPEPLPPTRSAPTYPPPRAAAMRGTSARLPADQLSRRVLETRAGTFLLGLLLGGLVAGGLTCLLTPDAKAPPASKVAPAAAPQPVACPKPPPCKMTSPRRVATPAPAPAKPAPAEEPGLSLKDRRQLHKYLRLANRAMKRHQWRRARNLASLALKLDPKERRAQRIKKRAERRLGR